MTHFITVTTYDPNCQAITVISRGLTVQILLNRLFQSYCCPKDLTYVSYSTSLCFKNVFIWKKKPMLTFLSLWPFSAYQGLLGLSCHTRFQKLLPGIHPSTLSFACSLQFLLLCCIGWEQSITLKTHLEQWQSQKDHLQQICISKTKRKKLQFLVQ